MLTLVSRCVTWMDNVFTVLAGIATASLAAAVTLDVVFRYVLGRPISGSFEFQQTYVLAAVVFLGMGWAFRRGAHVRISLVTRRLPPKLELITAYTSGAITALTGGCFALATLWAARNSYQSGETSTGVLRLPLWIGYAVASAGLVSLFMLLLLDLTKIKTHGSKFFEDVDAEGSI